MHPVHALTLSSVCRVDAGLEGLAPDLTQQLEEVLREGPDLCGMAVVSPCATSGNNGATLLRLSFLGHVSAQRFADPMVQPDFEQAQQQPAHDVIHAVYDIFPPSLASAGAPAALQSEKEGQNRSWPGQRLRPPQQSECDFLCSMSGHHAIAQAALRGSGPDNNNAAEVPEQTAEALSSLLQETEVQQAVTCLSLRAVLMLHCSVLHFIRRFPGVSEIACYPEDMTTAQQLNEACVSRCPCPSGRLPRSWAGRAPGSAQQTTSARTGGAWAASSRACLSSTTLLRAAEPPGCSAGRSCRRTMRAWQQLASSKPSGGGLTFPLPSDYTFDQVHHGMRCCAKGHRHDGPYV